MSSGAMAQEGIPRTAVYDRAVVGAALALAVLAVLLWGPGDRAIATALGGTLATANWLALRRLVGRLLRPVRETSPRRAWTAVLFGLKIVVLFGGTWFLIRFVGLDPPALALGYSALVVGLLGAAIATAGSMGAPGGGDA